ncbi:MAG: YwmB family TATA-box binding protein [Wujia sp.]
MNKRTKIYVVVLIWAAVVLQLFINSGFSREKILVEQVMNQEISNLTEGRVKIYGYYSDENIAPETKEIMVVKMAKLLGIKQDYEVSHKTDGDNETTILSKKGQNGDTDIKVITLATVDNMGNKTYENYMLVEVKLKEEGAYKAYDLKTQLVTIYEELGMDPTTNLYLGSQIKGKVTQDEMEQQIENFLKDMGAEQVERITFDEVVCVYGYSKNIDDYVYQGENRVNVNIAFSYDEQEDITYVHMAVPFVDKSF